VNRDAELVVDALTRYVGTVPGFVVRCHLLDYRPGGSVRVRTVLGLEGRRTWREAMRLDRMLRRIVKRNLGQLAELSVEIRGELVPRPRPVLVATFRLPRELRLIGERCDG
jgi:hypothetical protein